MKPWRSVAWNGYAFAGGALAVATALREMLDPVLGSQLTLVTYYVALMTVAWRTNVVPSLVTLLAGAFLSHVLFTPPAGFGSWEAKSDLEAIDLARYFLVGIGIVFLCEAMRASEAIARQRQARVDGILRTALDCIITIDVDNCVTEFNPAAERTFGYRRAEAIGRPLSDLIIPPGQRAAHRAGLARHLATGESRIFDRRIEVTAQRKDGTEIPVELAVTREDTDPPTFTAYLRDITERRQAEWALRHSLERFRTLVEQVKDYAIFTLDAQGRATSWNEGVQNVLGFSENEFVGLDIGPAIFTPEDAAAGMLEQEMATAAAEGSASDDRWMQRKDGTRFFALGTTTALHDIDGSLIGYTKIMRDQTSRKLMENELRDTAEELTTVVRHQTRFLAILSHELRNPLAPIRNAVEILRVQRAGDTSARPVIDMMSRQVSHMVRLIDDLLDLSRVRSAKIPLQRASFDLALAVRHALDVAAAQCEPARQELTWDLPDAPLMIVGDATRIAQVVDNLLHNACKFTPTGGNIHVEVCREGAQAVIRVRDSGIGIPEAQLATIFGMFAQLAEPGDKAQGGLGLGLHLAKSLVEMHGGSLSATSAGPGQGSEFTVRLPLSEAIVSDGTDAGEKAP